MRLIVTTIFALMMSAMAVLSQGFNPVLTVNGDAITAYELDQRQRMLQVFNTPGDLPSLAREQLIEDRLKLQELRRVGLSLPAGMLRDEMEAFAGRANLPYDQFIAILAQNGIAEETLRDFVLVGVSWREYVRSRFGDSIQIRDVDRQRALGGGSGVEVQVLLSEIIIPAPPQLAARATAEARRIAAMTSQAQFSAAARRVSALPSAPRGGRLSWVPITNFPPQLRPILLGLSQNQVTAPIQIPNGIALFQLRGIREVAGTRPQPAEIEYLTFSLPGGMSDATQAEAARIANRVDVCDDFYGIAHGLPAERLKRQSVAPSQIPQDIAQVIAGLDSNEVSYGLTRNQGQTMLMVMVCNRKAQGLDEAEVDLDALSNQLAGEQLGGMAAALLADLRSRAVIQ